MTARWQGMTLARTSIPPTRCVRRGTAKRWHIEAGHTRAAHLHGDMTACGQRIGNGARYATLYDAALIGCTDCLVAALRSSTLRLERRRADD